MAPSSSKVLLRLGTRGSRLAQTQSRLVARMLEARHPGVRVELVVIKTTGDRVTDRPLHDIGGKGLFTRELEQALLRREIDFAVHSYKDVPVTEPLVDQRHFIVAAVPLREDPRDVLVAPAGCYLADLPRHARVGTTSLRRRCQLLHARADLIVQNLRGNIDTRLRKLAEGEVDAIILAAAGLRRTGLFDASRMTILDPDAMLPAAGQGALAIQCRREDAPTIAWLGALNDPSTQGCVQLERELVRALEGDCHSPIGALATLSGGRVLFRAVVGPRGGGATLLAARAEAEMDNRHEALNAVTEMLLRAGAADLLRPV